MKKIPNKKEIAELKEEQQAFIEVCQMPCKDCKLNIIKEVLRKLFKRHEKSNPLTSFYTELLEMLDASSASHTVKPKMTDDEIMRFNEEIMAKANKREIQPLGKSEKIILFKDFAKGMLAEIEETEKKEREHYKHQHEYIKMAKECLEGEKMEKKEAKYIEEAYKID